MLPLFLFSQVLGCSQSNDSASPAPPSAEPNVVLPSPHLRRLSVSQYHNIITDNFGEGLVIPSSLEPDVQSHGLLSIGAALTSISPVGVERYEAASYNIATQLIEDESRLSTYIPCGSIAEIDDSCAQEFIADLGLQLWRRPLSEAELSRISNIFTSISGDSGSNETGVEFALATLLQSPHFLYRIEHGDSNGQLTDFELATRLSFFLWNTSPDEQLLSLAVNNSLREEGVLAAEVDRMLDDPRFQQGVRNFFNEVLTLYNVENMVKDPLVFTHASPDLALSSREETLLSIERIVTEDLDFRDIMTTQTTFVDRRLAALYNIQAPTPDGFAEVTLSASSGRRGLLGHASTLGLHSHATTSSATLRGMFIRKTLLCQVIPPPPADVDTSIPEADADSPTLRERINSHLEDPSCAGCHQMTDLVGLGLENFDGIGRWRSTENNAMIDASGNIDGTDFNNAYQLAEVVRNHPNLGSCFAEHLYQYAVGHVISEEEEAVHDWLSSHFEYSGWSFRTLMRTTALSSTFQNVGEIND